MLAGRIHAAEPRANPILLVDDHDDLREMLATALSIEGYRVSTAANGFEALLEARSHRPSLILLDLMMPVMDGPGFLAEQQRDPSLAAVPVIVVSAHGDGERIACEAGARAFIPKPIEIDRLLGTIDQICAAQMPT
jgi:CheY-like chemotaxis protein